MIDDELQRHDVVSGRVRLGSDFGSVGWPTVPAGCGRLLVRG
jgi:hypothetical protein